MKLKLLCIFSIFLFTIPHHQIFSQIWGAEIRIDNKTSAPVHIFLTPIGSVFSGHGVVAPEFQDNRHRYTIQRSDYRSDPPGGWVNIVGSFQNYTNVPANDFRLVDFDDGLYNSVNPTKIIGGIGPGFWRLRFTDTPGDESEPVILEECFLDYRDANYGGGYAGGNFTNDLLFELRL